MVKDHSYSERGNPLPPLHWVLFPISSMVSFYASPTYSIAYTTADGALAGTRNSSMGLPYLKEISKLGSDI